MPSRRASASVTSWPGTMRPIGASHSGSAGPGSAAVQARASASPPPIPNALAPAPVTRRARSMVPASVGPESAATTIAGVWASTTAIGPCSKSAYDSPIACR